MNAADPAPATPRRTSAIAWLLLFILVPLAGALAWRGWQVETGQRRAAYAEDAARTAALEQRVATLREGQQAQGKRLQQSEATNRLLRDELLAMGQRAALLEESVQRLASPGEDAARALRLEEVELLLAIGQQRLLLSADLEGARSAHALAARLLDALTDPTDIDLRQVLAQERAALDALGADPRVAAIARIDAFEAALPRPPSQPWPGEPAPADASNDAGPAPWWQRAARRLADNAIQVRRSDATVAVDAGERAAALAALRLELALARTAAERRDAGGHAAALGRAGTWLPRLWPDSPARRQQADELAAIAALPLAVELPTLGTTLGLLRSRKMNTATTSPALGWPEFPEALP